MKSAVLYVSFFMLFSTVIFGQTKNHFIKDSICRNGKKYDKPKRIDVNFPAKQVTNDYKLNALHKAIPDSFNNEDDTLNPEHWWLYHYYFRSKPLIDYDTLHDSIVELPETPLYYILRDTYFFDANGDGLLDFIHYPKYYKKMNTDIDAYEIFFQGTEGYSWTNFKGYIYDMEFSKDGTLSKLKTFEGPCCSGPSAYFYYYTFDKTKNTLNLVQKEKIFACQLKDEVSK